MSHAMAVLKLLALVGLLGCGLPIERAAVRGATLPRDRVAQCTSLCHNAGMRLGALVVIMNNAGCVCEPRAEAGVRRGGVAAAAGGAAIEMVLEQQREEEEQREEEQEEEERKSRAREAVTTP